MSFPREIHRGDEITAEWLNQLLRESKASVLVSSPGLRVSRLGTGTTAVPVFPNGNTGATQSVVVKITAAETGGGEYTGRLCDGALGIDGTADLAMPEDMTVGSVDVLVINLDEDGLPTHWLKINSFAQGVLAGVTTETPARQIVVIPRGWARIASPQELASGTGDSAQTDTWDRKIVTSGTNYGNCPVKVPLTSRPVYNSAGDQVLYKMVRFMIIAADGRVDSVTAETRVTVDATESCP